MAGTGVSQWWVSGFSPFTTAKNASCSAFVIGPRSPLPTFMRSTDAIGETSTAVPL